MENDILISHALDLARRCREEYVITSTPFLDLSERSAVDGAVRKSGAKYAFFGGYDDAERTVCVFYPDYIDDLTSYFDENPDECPISVLRCTYSAGAPAPSHRDYLGSLTGLGIKREKLGDISVYDGGADVLILKEIEKFLLAEYKSAGRVKLDVKAAALESFHAPEFKIKTERGSVASMRLDGLVSEIFSLSRDKAAEAIEAGLVFVDGARTLKSDAKVSAGSKLVLRGKGKSVIKEIVGTTKSGRTAIIYDKYL